MNQITDKDDLGRAFLKSIEWCNTHQMWRAEIPFGTGFSRTSFFHTILAMNLAFKAAVNPEPKETTGIIEADRHGRDVVPIYVSDIDYPSLSAHKWQLWHGRPVRREGDKIIHMLEVIASRLGISDPVPSDGDHQNLRRSNLLPPEPEPEPGGRSDRHPARTILGFRRQGLGGPNRSQRPPDPGWLPAHPHRRPKPDPTSISPHNGDTMKTILLYDFDDHNRVCSDTIVDDKDYVFLHKFTWRLYNGWAMRDDVSGDPVFMQHEVAARAGKPSLEIKHISGDTLDNRRENIRVIEPKPAPEPEPEPEYKTILLHHLAALDQIVSSTIVDYEDFAYLDKWNWRLHRSRHEAYREEDGKFIFMRDAVWEMAGHHGQCEHVSASQTRDNRRANLQPTRKPEPTPTSTKNLVDHGDKWQARISIDGDRVHLGYFPTILEAEAARLNVKEKVLDCIAAASTEPTYEPTATARPCAPFWRGAKTNWEARIKVNGLLVILGSYPTREQALAATTRHFTKDTP